MTTHTDTARSAALMPGERCPAPCVPCGDAVTLTIERDHDARYPEWYAVLNGPDGLTLGHLSGRAAPHIARGRGR